MSFFQSRFFGMPLCKNTKSLYDFPLSGKITGTATLFFFSVFFKMSCARWLKLLLIVLILSAPAVAQPYSIDKIQKRHHGLNLNIRGMFRKNPERKAKKKEEKEKDKAFKRQKKAIKYYWKHVDRPDEMGTNRSVYRRMKKDLRVANRINNDRHRVPFLKKLFTRKKNKTHRIIIKWPWKKKDDK
jgi:hypothetical protein